MAVARSPIALCTDHPPDAKMVVLGGSNTAGANSVSLTSWGRPHRSFASLFSNQLRAAGIAHSVQSNAHGGTGPILAGACADLFIPAGTRFGTVEFLPNIGYAKDDEAELSAIERILAMMRARGAVAFVISVVPAAARYAHAARSSPCGRFNASMQDDSVIGCMSRAKAMALRDALAALAAAHGAHVVEMDAEASPMMFGADQFHLNQEGHQEVASTMWRRFEALPCLAAAETSSDVGAQAGVACAMGDQLDSYVRTARHFARANVASAGQAPKLAWEGTAADAALELAVRLPLEAEAQKLARAANLFKWFHKDQVGFRAEDAHFKVGVGFLVSHRHNLPLLGAAHLSCEGCTCSCAASDCVFDTLREDLRATVTNFFTLSVNRSGSEDDDGTCVVRVANANASRTRLIVRALIFGLADFRTAWLRNPPKAIGHIRRS